MSSLRLGDPGHVLAVRVFSEERRSSDNNIDTVDTGLDSNSRVVHVTSDVCENLGVLEAKLANGFTVGSRFGRSCGVSELNVLDAEFVKPVYERSPRRCVHSPAQVAVARAGRDTSNGMGI